MDEGVSLIRIPACDVMSMWSVFEPVLALSVPTGDHFLNEILSALLTERMQLWTLVSQKIEGAGVTEIINTPQGRVCQIIAFGGKGMDRWLGCLDELEKWAYSQGCAIFRIIGRKGWARKLPDYKQERIMLDKRL